MAVEITRTDMSASELRTTAARTKDAKAARGMLAIALVLDGTDRRTAAEACGMDRQPLRDWVHRYNAEGIAGLSNRYWVGPTPLLNLEQKVELARMVREGLILRPMGWCAGAASISSARSRTALAWSCTSGRSANNWRPSAMNAHLVEIAKAVAPGAHAVLVMDGAGWHGSSALRIPDNITIVMLPPYAPELNPVENIWAYLRANRLAISVFDTYDDIVDRCRDAWNAFANDPERVRYIATPEYAKAVNG